MVCFLLLAVPLSGILLAQQSVFQRPKPGPSSLSGQIPNPGISEKKRIRQWRREQDALNRSRMNVKDLDQARETESTSLLIDEGFEGATFPPAGWTSVVVSGSPDWVQTSTSPHPPSSFAAYSEWGPMDTLSKKYLITKRVVLDGALKYQLTFWMMRGFAEPFDPDTVYVRLSTADSLPGSFTTLLYTCSTGPDTSTNPNIYTTTYKQFTVNFSGFSGHAWIAFDHEDMNGQSINLDDIQLLEVVNNDVMAHSVNDPLAGDWKNIGVAFQPKATFRNNGEQTQTSIPVRLKIYTVGGTAVYDDVQTISSLAPNVSAQVTFAAFTPSTPGNYTARAIAQNPGDAHTSNDSVDVQFRIPDNISGVRTVGPGGDFTTLSDAVHYLNDNNVAGPLTFSLTGAVYNESPIAIEPISYTSTTQPVLIQPAGGNSPFITISATMGAPYGIRLRNCSNLAIHGSNGVASTRNLTINLDTAGVFAPAILLTDGCEDISIENCVLKGYSKSNGNANSVIILDTLTSGRKDSNIVFDNLQILRGFNGFFIRGSMATATRITISGCDIGNTGTDVMTQAGIIAYNTDKLTVVKTAIHDVAQSSGIVDLYGIYIGDGSADATVQSNILHNIHTTVNGNFATGLADYSGTSSHLLCYNNFFYDILSSGSGTAQNYSVAVLSGDPSNSGEQFYYNSIYLSGYDSSTSSVSRSDGFSIGGGVSAYRVKNNIVVNTMTFAGGSAGNRGYCIYLPSAAWPAGSVSNHNDYYPAGSQGVVGFLNGANRTTLSDWKSGSSQDANSVSADPLFLSSSDLHIQSGGTSSPVIGQAEAVTGIMADIDGDVRNSVTPDIGADEIPHRSSLAFTTASNWNLLSVPVMPADPRVTTIFPAGRSSAAFIYEGSYWVVDTVYPGTGFWLRFTSPQAVSLDGPLRELDTLDLVDGWNLIGSLSRPLPISNVTGIGGATIGSPFFGYAGGYTVVDTLKPFGGYWVKMTHGGKVVLAATGMTNAPGKQTSAKYLPPEDLNQILVTDAAGHRQNLYFGIENDLDPRMYELPPRSPDPEFEASFTHRGLVGLFASQDKGMRLSIEVASRDYPVQIQWTVRNNPAESYSLSIGDTVRDITGMNSMRIDDPAIRAVQLVLNRPAAASSFRLFQNYPDPFNPTTTIGFELPVLSSVTLRVYNILGQIVRTIAENKVLGGGSHREDFNASTLPSGVYWYRLDATPVHGESKTFSEVRKMLLTK